MDELLPLESPPSSPPNQGPGLKRARTPDDSESQGHKVARQVEPDQTHASTSTSPIERQEPDAGLEPAQPSTSGQALDPAVDASPAHVEDAAPVVSAPVVPEPVQQSQASSSEIAEVPQPEASGGAAVALLPEAEMATTEPTPLERLCDELEAELSCALCAALFYKPVVCGPCGHAFCGSCLSLYLTTSTPTPHSCPSCRATATSATFSRVFSGLVDAVVKSDPSRARVEIEKQEADETWQVGEPLRFALAPLPPAPPRPAELYRPCRYCVPGWGWQCPIPIPGPGSSDAYPLDGPCPPGHYACAGCNRLSATGAPPSSACSICEDGYCGSVATGSCLLPSLSNSHAGPGWGGTNYSLSDAVYDPQCDELANAFHDNSIELGILGDYIASRPAITPAVVYSEILAWLASPTGLLQGGVRGLFRRIDQGIHSNLPEGKAIERVCHQCANDIFACGIFEWWLRRRPTVLAELPKAIARKPDCVRGRSCFRSGSAAHANKFNHVCERVSDEDIASSAQNDDPLPPLPPSPVAQAAPLPAQEEQAVLPPVASLLQELGAAEGAVAVLGGEAAAEVGGPPAQEQVAVPPAVVAAGEGGDAPEVAEAAGGSSHQGVSTDDLAAWLAGDAAPPPSPSLQIGVRSPLPSASSSSSSFSVSSILAQPQPPPSDLAVEMDVAAADAPSASADAMDVDEDEGSKAAAVWRITEMEVDQEGEPVVAEGSGSLLAGAEPVTVNASA